MCHYDLQYIMTKEVLQIRVTRLVKRNKMHTNTHARTHMISLTPIHPDTHINTYTLTHSYENTSTYTHPNTHTH